MKRGLLTCAAVLFGIVALPVVLGLCLIPLGLSSWLDAFGLTGLSNAASWVLWAFVGLLIVLAVWDARGSYHFREHVLDMAPGAFLFLFVVWLIGRCA